MLIDPEEKKKRKKRIGSTFFVQVSVGSSNRTVFCFINTLKTRLIRFDSTSCELQNVSHKIKNLKLENEKLAHD